VHGEASENRTVYPPLSTARSFEGAKAKGARLGGLKRNLGGARDGEWRIK
jgi:hypothetical protein